MTKVLMVCMGNICRSPMALAVLQKAIDAGQLGASLQVDSAGTAARPGERADHRAEAALRRRAYPLAKHKARRVSAKDFVQFDLLLAMDTHNLDDLKENCPPAQHHKLRLLTEFLLPGRNPAPAVAPSIPDPYYGNVQGFEKVLDICEAAVAGLVQRHRAGGL